MHFATCQYVTELSRTAGVPHDLDMVCKRTKHAWQNHALFNCHEAALWYKDSIFIP